MAKVRVYGNAWDGALEEIPASLDPVLEFLIEEPYIGPGLVADVEVTATWLNLATGSFEVYLDNSIEAMWIPVLSWNADPDDVGEFRRRARVEWPAFFAGSGGDISIVGGNNNRPRLSGVYYGFGEPPSWLKRAVYLDISGPGIDVYGPPNAYVGS